MPPNDLTAINERLGVRGSDKSQPDHTFAGQSYLDIYDRYFSPRRNAGLKLLEIGVLGGGSLRMWRHYFPNASIFGVDIDRATVAPSGTTVLHGDQSSKEFMELVSAKYGPFDIVVDDGSHLIPHAIASFEALWPHMPPKAIYAIEDTRMFYYAPLVSSPGMKYNSGIAPGQEWFVNERSQFDQWLIGLLKELDHHRGDIRAIHLHAMQVIIEKL